MHGTQRGTCGRTYTSWPYPRVRARWQIHAAILGQAYASLRPVGDAQHLCNAPQPKCSARLWVPPSSWNAMKISELSDLMPRAARVHVVWLALLLGFAVLSLQPDRAQAFGAVGAAAGDEVTQTSEQLILIDNPDSTVTAVIQLQLTGTARDLTWVIPVPAEPTLSLSSSTVFQRLSAVTAPQYWVELTDPCTVRDQDAAVQNDEEFADTQTGAPEDSPARVKIVEQNAIGPYEYVTLRVAADSGNPEAAISATLHEHGFAWNDPDSQQLTPYVQAGMPLLAIKLKKDAAAASNRPIAISYPSDELAIPIRATSVAARADMPLRVWVFADAHAVLRTTRRWS